MKIYKPLLVLLVALFAFSSFVPLPNDRKKLLVRKWKPVKMEVNGKLEEEGSDDEADMEFKADGKIFSEGEKVGSWKLKSDNKSLVIYIDDDGESATMTIEKLTKKVLVLAITRGSDSAKMYFTAL
ncbi:hypothetical protein [Microscilla marina]|uniref:Lipocalin-like domain-containing protein n=1 Tax=Microscilla marina ATCC 23134 TaxID=313606 RepID=A1ZQG8_MICM2|nr:hypothetical protein [Microscilla marina]EAY27340.1 hypothetical protein M23134_08292 [Microscilla marina ATCC 23134]